MQSSPHNAMLRYAVGFVLTATVLVSGCSSNRWGFPYRVGLQQGNWVTEQQVGLLYQGMTREQVRFALGSPTLTNVLHADRWDYPYFYRAPNRSVEVRNFTVLFSGDLLVSWHGDEQPALEPFQIAQEEVRKSQAEQAEVDLEEERLKSEGSEVQIAPGFDISLSNPALPSSDPYALPDAPDQVPIPLE
ncbi:outer membrane protein assembly factor BamE [Orrella marina]|nr:outer membrane protein assembly factor BamE [Orrella marina]